MKRLSWLSLILALFFSAPLLAAPSGNVAPLKVSSIEAPNIVHRVDTIAALRLITGGPGKKAAQLIGHTTAGDGGGGQFRYASGAAPGTYVDNNGTIIVPTGGNGSAAWLRVYSGDVNVRWFYAGADIGAAMRSADAVAAVTGGVVFYPSGDYTVTTVASEVFEAATHYYAVKVSDNVIHRGASGTKITMAAATNAHCFFLKNPTDSGVEGIEIDGNRANQTIQNPSTATDPTGILAVQTATRVRLKNLHIHDTPDYGIGFEVDNAYDCIMQNIVIERPGADGIDAKNRDDNSRGNVIENVTVRDMQPSVGQAAQQAGINPYGIWHLSDISIFELSGDTVGIRFNAGEAADTGGVGGHYSTLKGFFIEADALNPNVIGIMADAKSTQISSGTIRRGGIGVQIRQRENTVSDIFIESIENDGVKTVSGGFLTSPERNTLSNITVRAAVDRAFELGSSYNRLINCVARSSGTGFSILSGANNNSIIGGEATSNTTAVSDLGTSNVIRNVYGIVTELQVQSGTFDITTTGLKTIVIPHGLNFTPTASQCQITVYGGQNDVVFNYVRIALTDATNVTVAVYVSTPSAVGGAVASIGLWTRVKGQ